MQLPPSGIAVGACSSKSPSTPDSANLMIISNIVNYPVLGGINLTPPHIGQIATLFIVSDLVNYPVRGDLHERKICRAGLHKQPRGHHPDEERESFGVLLNAGFTDSFRLLHPDQAGAYSWWSYRFNARANNAGWRIDYFLVSNRLAPNIVSTPIYNEIFGSDHCPVGLEIDLSFR